MSYDIYLKDPITKEVLESDFNHNITGGTYAIGGTNEMWLNITYNYAPHFHKALGDNGIRSIYGMSGAESILLLNKAISKLDDDVSDDYWESTEGNAKRALYKLKALAELRPDGVWDGD